MQNIAQQVNLKISPLLESYADDIATQRIKNILAEGGTVTPEIFNLNKQIAFSILENSADQLIPTEQDIEVDVPVNDTPTDIDYNEEDIVGLVVRDAEGNEVVVPYSASDFEDEGFSEGDAPVEVQEANIAEAQAEGEAQAQAEAEAGVGAEAEAGEAIGGGEEIQPTGVESNEGMSPEEVIASEKQQITQDMGVEEELNESSTNTDVTNGTPITENTQAVAVANTDEQNKENEEKTITENTNVDEKEQKDDKILTESSNEFSNSSDMIKSIIGNITKLN